MTTEPRVALSTARDLLEACETCLSEQREILIQAPIHKLAQHRKAVSAYIQLDTATDGRITRLWYVLKLLLRGVRCPQLMGVCILAQRAGWGVAVQLDGRNVVRFTPN